MKKAQVSLDDWRYQQRLRDATLHSRKLQQDFPIDIIKPTRTSQAYYTGEAVRQELKIPEQISFDRYRRRLQELNCEEYYPSPLKKQKVEFVKMDHVREQKWKNEDILVRLKKELNGHTGRCKNGGELGKMAKRFVVDDIKKVNNKQLEKVIDKRESKNVNVDSKTKTEANVIARLRQVEIAELEEQLRSQHLSRTIKADRFFYNRLGEQEANMILDEVLLENLYFIAQDVFDEEEEKSRSKELSPEHLEHVENVLHEGPMETILIQKYNVDITRRHLQCLLPGTWLNDEVINFYFQMMSDRDEALVEAGVVSKRSHFFNSFFYTKVSEGGYNFINVRRWTRKIDLFAKDKIFIPVNVGNMHWCMAAIFMTEKRIQYYDSMNGSGAACLKVLLRYLHDESEHKKKQKFNDEGWELITTTTDTPQQKNGSDCGVFTCMFADYLSQNKPLTFKQKDIPFHRHRMVLHVSRGYIPIEEEGL